ncbi:MAG: PfkB family carbohydrate kinase [Myxococcota bacterium]
MARRHDDHERARTGAVAPRRAARAARADAPAPARSRAGARLDRRRIERLLDRFPTLEILVVGDVVLDEYLIGDVSRISPEAPVPVVHVRREATALGGAGNVVRNVVALGGRCRLCSCIGRDADGDEVMRLLAALGVPGDGVLRVAGRPTTRKSRVVAQSQQIVRVDRETHEPLAKSAAKALAEAVRGAAATADGAILEDYGKGLFTRATIRTTMQILADAGVPVAVDPKDELAPFRGAELVKPNLREAALLAGARDATPRDLPRIAARLRAKLGGAKLAITRGADGIQLFEGTDPGEGVHVAAPRREVFDVQGAGDTTIAALALALRAGATLREAAVVANAAAATVVAKVGTATASRDEVRAQLADAIAVAEASA